MSRASVTIRDAGIEDLPAIIRLDRGVAASGEGFDVGVRRLVDTGRRDRSEQFLKILGNPEVRVVLAEDENDGELAGLMVLTIDAISAALDLPAAFVHYLVVAPERRHRGVGRALLAEATVFADEICAEHIIVGVTTTARDVNRYYARLGFAPMALRRIASVPALRRSLGVSEPVGERRADARRRMLTQHLSPVGRPRLPRARLRRTI